MVTSSDFAKIVRALRKAESFYRQEIDAVGGCDHSVGICCCDDVRDYEELLELNKHLGIEEK